MKDSDSVGLRIKFLSENATKELKNLNSETKNLQKNLHSISDEVKLAFNTSAIIGFARLIKSITNTMINAGKAQTGYIENLHLLQVAYGETNSSGEQLVRNMAELSGLDISQLTKSLGKYRQLSNALGIASDSANLLSENLLKMQNDIASLYNLDTADVSKKLMSALTGETEAIKILGADITTTALQQKAYNLGIQESVTNMSQAEKTILRYLIVQDQLASSQGDFANTINSVANQTKIWNAQLDTLGRQLGSIFNAILKPMLPILNGILMAINTIIGTLLSLLGIKTNVSSISDDFLTLGTNISNAGKAGKEANKSLRGFDKLNVIKTPTSSSSGGTGGIGGGVNSKLLAQLKEYNDMLAETNNKATEVRDKILGWFGYTKDTNGVLQFSGKLIDKIKIGLLAGAGAFSALLPVLKLVKSMKSIFTGLGNLSKISKTTSNLPDVGKATKKFKVPKARTVLNGLGDVALIIGGLTLIVGAYHLLVNETGFDEFVADGLDTLIMLFKGLGSIAIPLAAMSGLTYALSKVDAKSLAIGFGELAGIISGMTILIGAIGYFSKSEGAQLAITTGIDTLVKVFEGIAKIIIPLGLLTGLAALSGLGSEIIIPGLGILALVVSATAAFIGAIGALITEFPSINTWIDNGIDILVKVFNGVGRILGALVGGFAGGIIEGIASSLPNLGTYLSEFATNGKDFFDRINNIDESSALGAKYMAEALLYITAANVLSGLSGIMGTLGTIKNLTLLPEFGKKMKEFQDNLGKDFDSETVKSAANAAKALTEVFNNLPKTGGWWQSKFGEKSLATISDPLPDFGKNMKSFYDEIKDINPEIVEKSANAAKSLASLVNNLPKTGGWWQNAFGEKGLGSISDDLVSFGKNFKSYYTSVADVSIETINSVNGALKSLIDYLMKIKDNNLGKTARNFGDDLADLSSGITKLFKTSISSSDASKIASAFGGSIGSAIAKGIKSKLNITNIKLTTGNGRSAQTLGTYSLKAYASGGFPTRGDMFIANEKAPEYVGSINNKPAVANQNQIVDGISTGVARAMLSIKSPKQPIVIEATGDTEGLLDFIQFKEKDKDRQYGL